MATDNTQELARDVRTNLNEIFPKETSISLKLLCDCVEDKLLDFLKTFVVAELRRSVAEENTIQFLELPSNYFCYDNSIFLIRTSNHSRDIHTLEVTIQSTDSSKSNLHDTPYQVNIDGYGRYTKVHLIFENTFLPHQEFLAEVIKTILESGYR